MATTISNVLCVSIGGVCGALIGRASASTGGTLIVCRLLGQYRVSLEQSSARIRDTLSASDVIP
eukprot:scaffold267679_cov23-Prasinocladus_malaysianus.AAC.1